MVYQTEVTSYLLDTPVTQLVGEIRFYVSSIASGFQRLISCSKRLETRSAWHHFLADVSLYITSPSLYKDLYAKGLLRSLRRAHTGFQKVSF